MELFFKWVKQHLRIKAFFGTSANAVKTQNWIAIIAYLLVETANKKLNLPGNLYKISRVSRSYVNNFNWLSGSGNKS